MKRTKRKLADMREPESGVLPIRWHGADTLIAGDWKNFVDQRSGLLLSSIEFGGSFDTIVDTYERVPRGRMVILGEAGAGKTFLAAALRRGLLQKQAEGLSATLPIRVSAGSWNPQHGEVLSDWLEKQLILNQPKLGKVVAPEITAARAHLESGHILPIIDGLDEMGATARVEAIAALSNFTGRFVLMSRTKQYADVAIKSGALKDAAVIELERLPADVVAIYFTTKFGSASSNPSKWTGLISMTREDELAAVRFGEIFSTPLMVYLAQTSYRKGDVQDPRELLDFDKYKTADAARQHLLRSFVKAAYETSPYKDTATRWLKFLASDHVGPEIRWWQLPDSVSWYLRSLIFGIGGCVLGGMIGTAIVAVHDVSMATLYISVVIGLFVYAAFPMWSVQPPGQPISLTALRARWKRKITCPYGGMVAAICTWGIFNFTGTGRWAWFALPFGAAIGAAWVSAIEGWRNQYCIGCRSGWTEMKFGVPTWFGGAAIIAAIGFMLEAPTGSLVWWAILGIVWGLFMDAAFMLAGDFRVEAAPGLRDSLRNNLPFAPVFIGMTAIAYGLIIGALAVSISGPTGVIVGISCGLIIGVGFGFGYEGRGRWLVFCRVWLPLRGKLPWDVVDFIEYSHKHEVLRRSGAVYQFRHELLRDAIRAGEPQTLH